MTNVTGQALLFWGGGFGGGGGNGGEGGGGLIGYNNKTFVSSKKGQLYY